MTFSEAAEKVLQQAGKPLHYKEITRRALAKHLIKSQGKTPDATMIAIITTDLKQHGKRSKFFHTGRGMFALREVMKSQISHERSYWLVSTSKVNFELDRSKLHFRMQGFRERNARTVKKFQPGDRVVYYIVRIKKFGATATITGTYRHDTSKLWSEDNELWPSRAPSKPDLVLEDNQLVDARALVQDLSWIKNKTSWGSFFQGSVRKIPQSDFEIIEKSIKASLKGKPVVSYSEGNRGPLKVIRDEGVSQHTQTQERLLRLGRLLSYESYVPKSDRKTAILQDQSLRELPAKGLSREVQSKMANIDVIWFEQITYTPVCFFEIETTTRFLSNLTKLLAILDVVPPVYGRNAGVYVVGNSTSKGEAERCMMEPAFLPIKDKCRDYRFISIEDIDNESQKSVKILEKAHQRINRARQRIEEEERRIREYRQKRFKLLPLTSERRLI